MNKAKRLLGAGLLVWGLSVSADVLASLAEFERDCNKNDGMACANLGSFYDKGEGVRQDLAKAAQLYEKACRLGEKSGCSLLGFAYYAGYGVQKDFQKAAQFLEKGCALGAQTACENLAALRKKIETAQTTAHAKDKPSQSPVIEKANTNTDIAVPVRNSGKMDKQNTVVLLGEKYSLQLNKPPHTKGPFGPLNQHGVSKAGNKSILESSAKFNARFPLTTGSGVSYIANLWEATQEAKNSKVSASAAELAEKALARIGLKPSQAGLIKVIDSGIPGAITVGYLAEGIPFGQKLNGQRVAYVYAVLLPGGKAGYALTTSVIAPLDKTTLAQAGIQATASDISKAYADAFWDIYDDFNNGLPKNIDISKHDADYLIASSLDNGKGEAYWRDEFKNNVLKKRVGPLACVNGSFPDIRKKYGDWPTGLVCKMFIMFSDGSGNSLTSALSEAEDYVQLIDPSQNEAGSREALEFLNDGQANGRPAAASQASKAMNWLINNYEIKER